MDTHNEPSQHMTSAPCYSFRQHLKRLQAQGFLQTVSTDVSTDLELAAIVRQWCQRHSDPSPLLFTSADNATIIANLFATKKNLAQLVTGRRFNHLGRCIDQLDRSVSGIKSFSSWLNSAENTTVNPRTTQSMHRLTDLNSIPAVKVWKEDGGCYLSMAVVISRRLDGGEISCGLYRVQIQNRTQVTIHWRPGSDGARIFQAYQSAGLSMPVTIVLGCNPALTYAAAFPLPDDVSEYRFASFLQQQSLEVVLSDVDEIPIPAECEYILEGHVSVDRTMNDGPFGNHQGFYSKVVACPVVDITQISAREDAIYPVSIIGPPPSESSVIGSTFVDIYLPLLQREIDQLIDIFMPEETVFHGCALIRLRVDSQLGEVKHTLQKSALLSHSKLIVYVDEAIDVRNPSQVFWRVVNQMQPEFVQIVGSTMVIDATGWTREQRKLVQECQETEFLVRRRWEQYGLGAEIKDNL